MPSPQFESGSETTASWEIYEAVRPLSEHVSASLAAAYALNQVAACVADKGSDVQRRISDIREAIESVDAALDQLLDQLRASFLAQESGPDHRSIGLFAIRALTAYVSGSMMMIESPLIS
jgi:phytoene/squalene synthetase